VKLGAGVTADGLELVDGAGVADGVGLGDDCDGDGVGVGEGVEAEAGVGVPPLALRSDPANCPASSAPPVPSAITSSTAAS